MIYFWEISYANNYYSTEQAILSIIDQIQRGIDDNDFSKSSGGVVLRAFAPHLYGPGSISRLGVICGLSLLVLFSALRGFPLGTLVFPSPQKPAFD